jgi:hypothetical protein
MRTPARARSVAIGLPRADRGRPAEAAALQLRAHRLVRLAREEDAHAVGRRIIFDADAVRALDLLDAPARLRRAQLLEALLSRRMFAPLFVSW